MCFSEVWILAGIHGSPKRLANEVLILDLDHFFAKHENFTRTSARARDHGGSRPASRWLRSWSLRVVLSDTRDEAVWVLEIFLLDDVAHDAMVIALDRAFLRIEINLELIDDLG